MSHTRTPWKVAHLPGKKQIVYIAGAVTFGSNVVGAGQVSKEDAAHIVACVNVHDELVAALQAIVEQDCAVVDVTQRVQTIARAALAMQNIAHAALAKVES